MDRNNIVPIVIYLLLDEDERRNFMRLHRRQLRDVLNPFEMPEKQFQSNFRLYKELTRDLIDRLRPYAAASARSTRIPFYLRVLAFLHFLAKGSYQHAVGQCSWIAMSQSCISRSIVQISRLIVEVLMPEWIQFPTAANEKAKVKLTFYEKYNFRGVLGCIDGSHVAIVCPPSTDQNHPPHVYLNRKGFYSINVMMIGDADGKILACDARFPGSVHDSAIWRVQHLRNYLREEYNNGDNTSILLGDSGYGLEPWLFTPFSVAVNGTPEARFNELLRSTRNVIERIFGILKGRWRALLHHRVLHYHPADAAFIIYAGAVLHNIAVWANIEFDENDMVYDYHFNDNNFDENEERQNDDENLLQQGRLARENYIRRNNV